MVLPIECNVQASWFLLVCLLWFDNFVPSLVVLYIQMFSISQLDISSAWIITTTGRFRLLYLHDFLTTLAMQAGESQDISFNAGNARFFTIGNCGLRLNRFQASYMLMGTSLFDVRLATRFWRFVLGSVSGPILGVDELHRQMMTNRTARSPTKKGKKEEFLCGGYDISSCGSSCSSSCRFSWSLSFDSVSQPGPTVTDGFATY